MVDESKLIFYTGAPGSKWSATAHLITMNSRWPINTSDYSKERTYTHENKPIAHQGAYWGPGNGIGENFHQLSNMGKDEVLHEIDKPYSDKSWDKYRLIKCHHFSSHLDWIKENFPQSKILIVLRPDIICLRGWLVTGGFHTITYPNYSVFYKNKFVLEELNVVRKKYWKNWWGIDCDTEEKETYMYSLEGKIDQPEVEDTLRFDVTIADYNF
jgi:hypothetical protein